MRPMVFRLKERFRDGRESEAVKQVLAKAEKNPESVLKVFNEYTEKSTLMIIGSEKGAVLGDAVASCNPKNSLELGSYVGYSATLIGSKMPNYGKLISMENNPSTCERARQVVNHAGLSDRVVVIEGTLEDKLDEVKEMLAARGATSFDFVFLDHWGSCYLPDFLLLKEHGLVAKGTTIVADNMLRPEKPSFRKYVEENPDEFQTVVHRAQMKQLSFLLSFVHDEVFVLYMNK